MENNLTLSDPPNNLVLSNFIEKKNVFEVHIICNLMLVKQYCQFLILSCKVIARLYLHSKICACMTACTNMK